ncbi:MAG: hypothetical protein FWC06_06115 [Treponema sp.]|nr:hypothetical protein [Treponema sp.]
MLKSLLGQLSRLNFSFFLIFLTLYIFSCSANREETPVVPPETSPLTGGYIGFGVITASFTHISIDPAENSESLGYLRRGSLVKVIRRQIIRTLDGFVSWVFIEGEQGSGERAGDQSGWLKEEVMEIYSNESQARTASESI